jgi:hypothetical protein
MARQRLKRGLFTFVILHYNEVAALLLETLEANSIHNVFGAISQLCHHLGFLIQWFVAFV